MNRIFVSICALILCVGFICCGRFDKQQKNILSSTHMQTVSVSCLTFFGVPTMCMVVENNLIEVEFERVVTQIVEIVVEKEVVKKVPVKYIVYQTYEKFHEKNVDIDVIVKEVLRRVRKSIPINVMRIVPVQEIVEQVVQEVVESTDYTPVGKPIVTTTKPKKVEPTLIIPPKDTPVEMVDEMPVEMVDEMVENGDWVVWKERNGTTGVIHEDYFDDVNDKLDVITFEKYADIDIATQRAAEMISE